MLARRVLDLDFDEFYKWCDARGTKMPKPSLFPRVGYIINGVAAGFIYFTDSPIAIIDCYLSNPDTDSKTRSDALNVITEALIKCAKFHKCKAIKCDTQLEVIKTRAKEHGFRLIGTYESFLMEL